MIAQAVGKMLSRGAAGARGRVGQYVGRVVADPRNGRYFQVGGRGTGNTFTVSIRGWLELE